ncbi:hypothetical protein [Mycobacterium shigaense]|uniref:hypothetical protein n=1 Tax=Mycobacterium shigaense TaxID=722731 RepID=UPI00115BFBB0|nr:hypothetical protein [Mycobacterium shigaense]MEA1121534.1 hypothetical protein [Mycobacterium shigaense]
MIGIVTLIAADTESDPVVEIGGGAAGNTWSRNVIPEVFSRAGSTTSGSLIVRSFHVDIPCERFYVAQPHTKCSNRSRRLS